MHVDMEGGDTTFTQSTTIVNDSNSEESNTNFAFFSR